MDRPAIPPVAGCQKLCRLGKQHRNTSTEGNTQKKRWKMMDLAHKQRRICCFSTYYVVKCDLVYCSTSSAMPQVLFQDTASSFYGSTDRILWHEQPPDGCTVRNGGQRQGRRDQAILLRGKCAPECGSMPKWRQAFSFALISRDWLQNLPGSVCGVRCRIAGRAEAEACFLQQATEHCKEDLWKTRRVRVLPGHAS